MEIQKIKIEKISASPLNPRKTFDEVAIEELDEVEEKIKVTIIQTIISFIENYDYFVKELETDDYFYGLEDSKDE